MAGDPGGVRTPSRDSLGPCWSRDSPSVHDPVREESAAPTAGDARRGLLFALTSAVSFGLAGTMAAGLYTAGWSAGAAVSARITIAAVVLIGPGMRAIDGRITVLIRNGRTILAYGVLAVTGSQLCYFYAVARLPVGVALLIEYTAPVAVVGWMWATHGQRPTRATVVGAAVAAVGLVLLLDLVGVESKSGGLDLIGVLWALGAMVGAAAYFVMSADTTTGLPPIALASSGLVVGAVVLGVAAVTGLLPIEASGAEVVFDPFTLPWWMPVLLLGLVSAALAYVTGIAAGRRLGSRLASFVALSEVVAATAFAWWLLGQEPLPIQFVGAAILMAGVVVVRLGEPARS